MTCDHPKEPCLMRAGRECCRFQQDPCPKKPAKPRKAKKQAKE